MNAYNKGSESGWSCQIIHPNLTKEQYDKLGWAASQRAYKRVMAQAQFLKGWGDRWSEPHPRDCTCQECKDARSMIETY